MGLHEATEAPPHGSLLYTIYLIMHGQYPIDLWAFVSSIQSVAATQDSRRAAPNKENDSISTCLLIAV